MKIHNALSLAAVIILILIGSAFAEDLNLTSLATLEQIRVGFYPQKIRVVFDLSGASYFSYTTAEGELDIFLYNTNASENVGSVTKVDDWIVQELDTYTIPQGLVIKVPLPYPIPYTISSLSNPSRVVLDFGRSFTQIKKSVAVSPGVDFYSVVKGNADEFVTASVLDVDLSKNEIFPAMAKPSQSLLDSVVKFFNPWAKKKKPGFFKSRVSDIVSQNKALAGINGTYFDSDGQPLGVLMIDGKIISYPISDRTALVITQDNKASIDNILMDAYFTVNDIKYAITGINEPRDESDDIILYTPDFGEYTKTNKSGLDIAVDNGKVTTAHCGNTWIPENGYVLSAGPLYAENMSQTIKEGDKVSIVLNVIPYSTSFDGELKHLIGGGPRLLKSGRIYISKYEENFKRDIARGRAARTAVGTTKDDHLLFVTVDGRVKGKKSNNMSAGMSLTELAYFLQSLGAIDALNLDGGGSSAMVVRDKVMNRPVDGGQRRVSNAILIKPSL